jgi:hypothetical protein
MTTTYGHNRAIEAAAIMDHRCICALWDHGNPRKGTQPRTRDNAPLLWRQTDAEHQEWHRERVRPIINAYMREIARQESA